MGVPCLVNSLLTRGIFLAVLCCLALFTSRGFGQPVYKLQAGEYPHLKEHGLFLDPAFAPQTLQEASALLDNAPAWRPLRGESLGDQLRYGFSWRKITIHNPGDESKQLFLACIESTTPKISAAILRDGVITQHWQTGSWQPYSARPTPHRQFLFPFELAANETVTVLVGVEALRMADLVKIVPRQEFLEEDNAILVSSATQTGAIMLLSFLVVLLYLVTRNIAILYLYFNIVCSAVHKLGRDGFLDQFVYPNTGGITNPLIKVSITLAIVFLLVFLRRFLEFRKLQANFMYGTSQIFLALGLTTALAAAFMPPAINTPLVSLFTLLSAVYIFFLWVYSVFRAREGRYPSRVFAWFGGLYFVPAILTMYYYFFRPDAQPTFWINARSGEILFALALYVALLYDLRREQLQKQAALLKAEARTQFFATMNHELRTPLNGVIGTAELLSQTEQSPLQQQYSETIISSGNLLLALINDILDLTKISEGKLEFEHLPYELDQTLFDCVSSFLPMMFRKNVLIYVHIAPDMPNHLIGDEYRIRQVIYNLLNNAMKFTDSGKVVVSADAEKLNREDRYRIVITISDTGVGISPEAIERIFEQFSQADASTTRQYGGSGLGLTICKAILSELGGEISVESTPGEGSQFTISYQTDIDLNGENYRKEALKPLAGKRILMVSDSPGVFDTTKESLVFWGLNLTQAESAEEALDLLNTRTYDAAILYFLDDPLRNLALFANFGLNALAMYHYPITTSQLNWQGKLVTLPVPTTYFKVAKALTEIFIGKTLIPPQLPEPGALESLHALKVLVVEDNPTNKMVAIGMLNHLGLNADSAENGQQAVDMCKACHYHLIFMDCEMPVLDGYQATRKILSNSPAPKPIVIALTAQSMEYARKNCMDAGMHSVLYKPITRDKLRECLLSVKELLGDLS